MIKRISFIFTMLFTIMFVASCGLIDTTGLTLKAPTVTLDSFIIKNVSIEKTDFLLTLNIANSSSIGANVKKVEYNVDLNNIKGFISGTTENVIQVKANEQNNKIEIPISLENSKAPSLISSINADTLTKMPYKVSGNIYLDALVTDIPIPFNFEGNLDITTIVKMVVGSFGGNSTDLLGAFLGSFLPK